MDIPVPNVNDFVAVNPFPPLWRPIIIDLDCKTRVLLVADGGLNFDPSSGFGLSEARDVIAAAATTVHDVEVTTAHWSGNPSADVTGNFRFSGTHTVFGDTRTIHDYQEIWIFGISSATAATAMSGADLSELETFMDNGGGVFATGDHNALGAFLSGNVKRVRNMRLWFDADGAPDGTNAASRIDTNVPNAAAGADFDLQSDCVPQRIYPKWYVDGGNVLAHELFHRHDLDGSVTHLPDHPHEGRVVEPAVLDPAEFPAGVAPEIVAWGVSGGPGTSSKDPVVPELFGVVGAYDGHQADVGRIVVESTWHHYVNINLNGTGAGTLAGGVATAGLYKGGAPTPEYEQIQQYFQNIVGWLEPNRLRICSIIIWLPCLRWTWPLVQEIDFKKEPTLDVLVAIGDSVVRSIKGLRGGTREELVSYLTADMAMEDGKRSFLNPRWPRGREIDGRIAASPLVDPAKLGNAIIGGALWNVAQNLPDTEAESVEAVRKLLRLGEGRPDTSAMMAILKDGADLGLKLVADEFSSRSSGLASVNEAFR